ncbi:hypothetical protein LCGC14_2989590 [marine sediment metagenome]|uniref:Uncharacterized protein n=1 Tax=marine sediment metagenome TaxID=412755 RepID=A0A0F8XRV1_9ZZZZ
MKWTTADTLAVVGVLTVCGGTAWIYPPAGLILLGILVAGSAVVLDIAKRRNDKGDPE